MAWLGHIDILKFVIQNGWGSALILEDDVDWDVNIRNQTLLIAKAVLTLTNHEKILQAPYGLDWDVLWMGHCSDPADFNRPHVLFEDPTVIPLDRYVGLNTGITTVLKDGQRCVNYSQNPVCVSRRVEPHLRHLRLHPSLLGAHSPTLSRPEEPGNC